MEILISLIVQVNVINCTTERQRKQANGLIVFSQDNKVFKKNKNNCILYFQVKRGFHETTKVIKIDHRCIQIDLWVLETSRHRPMDIGAVLAAHWTCYFIIGRQ